MEYLISKEYSEETPFYFYKTTNLINNNFYYGSGSSNNHSYIGSGVVLKRAIKKYGKHNFSHERLRYFKTREDAYMYEERFLTIYNIKNMVSSYNLRNKGLGFDINNKFSKNRITVVDKDMNTLSIPKEEFNTSIYNGVTKGKYVYMLNGNYKLLSINDPLVISGHAKNTLNVNMGVYKDINGKVYRLPIDHIGVLSGDFVPFNLGNIPWNRIIEIDGIKKTASEWANNFGVKLYMLLELLNDNNTNYRIIECKKYKPFTSRKLEIDGNIRSVKYWTKLWGIPRRKKNIIDYMKDNEITYKVL